MHMNLSVGANVTVSLACRLVSSQKHQERDINCCCQVVAYQWTRRVVPEDLGCSQVDIPDFGAG